jgi:hypothetical protein
MARAIQERILAMPEVELEAFFVELARFITVLAEGFDALTPKERQRKMKLHAQRSAAVPDIVRLANQFGIDTRDGAVKTLAAHEAAASRLLSVKIHFEGVSQLVDDLRLANEDEMWRSALSIYGILKAEAKRDPVLADGLSTVQGKLKRKKKRSGPKA